MKIISKRISRNEFISRKNGVIPSLVDMWIIPETQLNCGGSQSYVFGTYESAADRIRELGLSPSLLEYKANFVYQDHNYGLIVSDIIIPDNIAKNITDYTDIYVNIPNGSGGYYDLNDPKSSYHYEGRKIMHNGNEVKILTYTTLNKWYTFFKKYKKTIKMYDNAIGLYDAECKAKNEYNRKKYSDLDDLFNARGGDTMYNWIIENCMPHENDYDDDETNDLQVKETFNYATNSASYVIPILITNSIDDLGEMTMFSSKWKDGVDYHNRAEEIGKCDKGSKYDKCYGTVVDRPQYRSNSSEEFYACSTEDKVFDLNTNFDDDSLKTSYETYLLTTGKGYEQNKITYENEFAFSNWTGYTDWYIGKNSSEFISRDENSTCVSTYAYSHSGKVLYNPTEDCETIDYIKKDYILANGELIDVVDGYYTIPSYTNGCVANVKLKKNIKIPVKVDGALKYAELNGKKFYALKDRGEEKIYFLKESHCYDAGSPIIQSKYIIFNGNVFPFVEKNVIIETDEGKYIYCIFNGYFWYKGILFYVLGDKVGLPVTNVNMSLTTITFEELDSDTLSKLGWESVSVNDGKVKICHKLDIKHADIISGYTDSKLDLLRRRKINTDELGNELPGYFDLEISSEDDGYEISIGSEDKPKECGNNEEESIKTQFVISDKVKVEGKTYNTPYDQCTLDLLYKVGEVSNIDYQKFVNGELLFTGNYLESIKFYQVDDKGGKINQTLVECEDSRPYLELYCKEPGSGEEVVYCNGDEIGNVGKYYDPEKVLYCDITYYIGATLVFNESTYKYEMADGKHKGVKYVDTLTVTKTTGDFYMSDNSFFTFIYYELRGNMSGQHLDDFRDNKLTNMSYFEMKIKLYDNACYDEDLFSKDYWENNNGMIAAPVFRTEYNLFSSTPQNVDSDIYIDRGINAAFEKHIKLQEVHTLEALENYGNGYFKINEY